VNGVDENGSAPVAETATLLQTLFSVFHSLLSWSSVLSLQLEERDINRVGITISSNKLKQISKENSQYNEY
jgi:hypothetical protein